MLNCQVFPTHVGVFLSAKMPVQLKPCLPHARGGVSAFPRSNPIKRRSSPRTWGCFWIYGQPFRLPTVFPTHVGVFLHHTPRHLPQLCLPHARGGVSQSLTIRWILHLSSPRTWGCFFTGFQDSEPFVVFPTHVGVFLTSFPLRWPPARLPHARGGVS